MNAAGLPVISDARWIWDSSEVASQRNQFLMFRRSVDLQRMPDLATLSITAADRYMLYANGKYIGRGPARSDPRWKSYDTWQLEGKLRRGKNTIAVIGYHYGQNDAPDTYRGNAYTTGERAGLWAKLEMGGGGGTTAIATGPDWLVRPALGWKRDVAPVNPLVGFPEVYDARRDPVDWAQPGFDDSGWQHATLVAAQDRPWKTLEPRDVPMMWERELFPVQVVKTGETAEMAETNVHHRFMKESHLPLGFSVLENPEWLLKQDGQPCRGQAKAAPSGEVRQPFVLIDFGQQMFGFPRVRMNAPDGAVVDMITSPQSVDGRIDKLGAMQLGDRYIARPGEQTWQTFEYHQFRYLQIAVRSLQPVEIESVSVNGYQYPADRRGRFECSDPVLTKVWQACVNTVYLQMEDTLAIDGWRERVNWAALDHIEAIVAAFGDTEVVRRHFRMIAREPFDDGRLPIHFPPAGVPMQWIPQSLLIWLAQVNFYYEYAGDRKFLAELYPAVKRQMDWYTQIADTKGLLDVDKAGYWNWCDWELPPHKSLDNRGACFANNAMYLAALEAGARMADIMEDSPSAGRWTGRAAAVREELRKFWNEKRGLFEDAFYQGTFTGRFSEMANGLALQYGVASPAQSARIISQFSLETPLDVAKPTPIWIGQILWALVGAGGLEKALELIRGRYDLMVKGSAEGTIWELWAEDHLKLDTRSVVHGGNAPALILSREVLGVKGVGPGFQQCLVEVPNLKSIGWAKGVFPSVRGDIGVHWRRDGVIWAVEVDLPAGLKTKVVLPKDMAWRSVVLDGNKTSADELLLIGGKHRVQAEAKQP